MTSCSRISVSFGPRKRDFGSWEWVGADTARFLANEFDVRLFDDEIPPTDIVVFVKFKPDLQVLRLVAKQSAVIYCPIDIYGGEGEIRDDAEALKLCDVILIHCERLRRHFDGYSRVEYIDHHLKFAAPIRQEFQSAGPVLWVGVRSNLPPIVEWANSRTLPEDLWILTNPENPGYNLRAEHFGFHSKRCVRIEEWTPERHVQWTSICRAAVDVKGNDFRSAHKPPTKALDFIASGVPLALSPASSPMEHIARAGFDVASVEDQSRWFSREYWEETARFGAAVAEMLNEERLRIRWSNLISRLLCAK